MSVLIAHSALERSLHVGHALYTRSSHLLTLCCTTKRCFELHLTSASRTSSSYVSALAAVRSPLHACLGGVARIADAAVQQTIQTPIVTHLSPMPASSGIWWPLLLSALAGLSTAVGGLIAVSFSSNQSTLAFLLGTAMGVMATVSCVELWWHSAVQLQDWLGVTAAVAVGAVAFALLDPLLPQHHEPHQLLSEQEIGTMETSDMELVDAAAAAEQGSRSNSSSTNTAEERGQNPVSGSWVHAAAHQQQQQQRQQQQRQQGSQTSQQAFRQVASKLEQLIPHKLQGSRLQLELGKLFGTSTASSSRVPDLEVQIGEAPLLRKSAVNSSGTEDRQNADLDANTGELQQQQQQQQQRWRQHHVDLRSGQTSKQQPGHLADTAAGYPGGSNAEKAHQAGLLRLALVMALTMTLHNLPEGFAVAFSAYTDIGPVMTLAIALHNIPEGWVIAAPLYAATGSKLKALGLALASGLSEPLGALVALLLLKPFVTSVKQLDYVLAGTGGVMLAVCVLELWPEERRCEKDGMLVGGMLLGGVVMAWTLWIGA